MVFYQWLVFFYKHPYMLGSNWIISSDVKKQQQDLHPPLSTPTKTNMTTEKTPL